MSITVAWISNKSFVLKVTTRALWSLLSWGWGRDRS